jgi:hypothetical protein
MQLSREYVTYMSKELMKRLADEGLVQFDQPEYADQMKSFGATYEDAFKAIKKQIIRERKIVI